MNEIIKRKRPTPLTSRAMADAREMGFVAEKVEQKVPKTFITRDFAGFADLILFRPGVGIIAVQVTSGSNHAARRAKIAAEPKAETWLQSGGRIEIWSYAKQGSRGERKLWKLRREEITAESNPDDDFTFCATATCPRRSRCLRGMPPRDGGDHSWAAFDPETCKEAL